MMEPRKLTDQSAREMARSIRDEQWSIMERMLVHDPLWFCVWNKRDLPELQGEARFGLLGGLEIMEWFDRHPGWFNRGDWDDDRYAFPISLTEAGRTALKNRDTYDKEPVFGGLVEPGWQAIPAASAGSVT